MEIVPNYKNMDMYGGCRVFLYLFSLQWQQTEFEKKKGNKKKQDTDKRNQTDVLVLQNASYSSLRSRLKQR